MRSFLIAAAFVVSSLCAVGAVADDKFKEIVIKTIIYCDHCAQCEDCEPKIENAVNVLKGIKYAVLDVETQTVKVIYNPEKIDAQAIKQAIANAGFAADELEPNPQAYEKLDECCKKK